MCHIGAMNLSPYVANLHRELARAAEAGGEETREIAERLTAPLESATRLTLLDALTAAADEITRDLAPGSVHVRLRGRDADFVVTPGPGESSADDIPQTGQRATNVLPPAQDLRLGAARVPGRLQVPTFVADARAVL
jgi:hypothetical protein